MFVAAVNDYKCIFMVKDFFNATVGCCRLSGPEWFINRLCACAAAGIKFACRQIIYMF